MFGKNGKTSKLPVKTVKTNVTSTIVGLVKLKIEYKITVMVGVMHIPSKAV